MNQQFNVAIIGAGAMGGAVAQGLVLSGYAPSLITVANPHEEKLTPFAKAGCRVTTDNVAAIAGASLIIIAVKPWILHSVAVQIRDHIDCDTQQLALIVAGVSGEELKEMFAVGERLPSMAVVMPNTAVALCRSMTFIVELAGECQPLQGIFSRLGGVMTIGERQLPAATALASCGIAYALRYIRAAVEGGVELGFKADVAQEIVANTLEGAVALLANPGAHPETEIDKVTTPGGITIRGLNAMEAAGFTPAVIAGLRASVK